MEAVFSGAGKYKLHVLSQRLIASIWTDKTSVSIHEQGEALQVAVCECLPANR